MEDIDKAVAQLPKLKRKLMERSRALPFRHVAIEYLSMSRLIPVSEYKKPTALTSRLIEEVNIYPPVMVRELAGNVMHPNFEIIYGEEFWFAAQQACHPEIQVQVIDDLRDHEIVKLRQFLQQRKKNPIELASEIADVLQRLQGKKKTLTRAGELLGYSPQRARNLYQMLNLPPEVQAMIEEGALTEGHAKLLLSIDLPAESIRLARRVVDEKISCAGLQALVRNANATEGKRRYRKEDGSGLEDKKARAHDAQIRHIGRVLARVFGCRATLDTVSQSITFTCKEGRAAKYLDKSEKQQQSLDQAKAFAFLKQHLPESIDTAVDKIEIMPKVKKITLYYGGKNKVTADSNLNVLLEVLLGEEIELIR